MSSSEIYKFLQRLSVFCEDNLASGTLPGTLPKCPTNHQFHILWHLTTSNANIIQKMRNFTNIENCFSTFNGTWNWVLKGTFTSMLGKVPSTDNLKCTDNLVFIFFIKTIIFMKKQIFQYHLVKVIIILSKKYAKKLFLTP